MTRATVEGIIRNEPRKGGRDSRAKQLQVLGVTPREWDTPIE